MSETATVETPHAQPEVPPPAPTPIESAPSVAEHAAQFGPAAREADDERPPVVVPVKNGEQGKFQRLSRSERRSIFGRNADLEQQVAALKKELADVKTKPAAQDPPPPAPAPVAKAAPPVKLPDFPEPKPTAKALQEQGIDDPYEALPEAYDQWNRRRVEWEKAQTDTATVMQQGLAHLERFRQTITAALSTDPALASAVQALDRPDLPDVFRLALWRLDNAAEIVKYLAAHPEDLADALALSERPITEAAVALTSRQLRRLTAAGASGAAMTGASTPAPKAFVVPRPPTPVQTKPLPPADPPPTDGSLSIAEHAKRFGRTARR